MELQQIMLLVLVAIVFMSLSGNAVNEGMYLLSTPYPMDPKPRHIDWWDRYRQSYGYEVDGKTYVPYWGKYYFRRQGF